MYSTDLDCRYNLTKCCKWKLLSFQFLAQKCQSSDGRRAEAEFPDLVSTSRRNTIIPEPSPGPEKANPDAGKESGSDSDSEYDDDFFAAKFF
jgi:hypothetical protein